MDRFENIELRIWVRGDGTITLNTTESRKRGTTAEVFAHVPKGCALHTQLEDFVEKRNPKGLPFKPL